MIGYVTLDCRDGVHSACEHCHCHCHGGETMNPNLPAYRTHAARHWPLWALGFVIAVVLLVMGSASVVHAEETDPCDAVAYADGGAAQWDPDGVLVGVIVNVESVGDVAPYATVQALLDGDSVFFQRYQGEINTTLQVRAAPDVQADVVYVTSGWPGGRTCAVVFEREARDTAPAPVDVTQAEYPPSTPTPNASPTVEPVSPQLAQTGTTPAVLWILAGGWVLVVGGFLGWRWAHRA